MLIRYLIKSSLLPPLVNFLMLLLAWLIRKQYPDLSRVMMVVGLGSLILLTIPWVAMSLVKINENLAPLNLEQAEGAQAIVVLSGGSYIDPPEFDQHQTGIHTLLRLRYAAWLYHRLDIPILVTGGDAFGRGASEAEIMANTLSEQFNVPVKWQERESRTTWENATLTKALLKPEESGGSKKIILVTEAFHMRRSIWSFEEQGFEVVSAPTHFLYTGLEKKAHLAMFVPNATAFNNSRQVLHEWLGQLIYRTVY